MNPDALSRRAIEGIRYVQALFLAVAGVTPLLAAYADNVSQATENLVAAVTAAAGLTTVALEAWKKRNTTPSSDPRTDDGVPLTPIG